METAQQGGEPVITQRPDTRVRTGPPAKPGTNELDLNFRNRAVDPSTLESKGSLDSKGTMAQTSPVRSLWGHRWPTCAWVATHLDFQTENLFLAHPTRLGHLGDKSPPNSTAAYGFAVRYRFR